MFQFAGCSSPPKRQGFLSLQERGFPHSEICGSKVACHLTAAYRRLLRPSSSSYVKASTIHSYCDFPTLLFLKLQKRVFDIPITAPGLPDEKLETRDPDINISYIFDVFTLTLIVKGQEGAKKPLSGGSK